MRDRDDSDEDVFRRMESWNRNYEAFQKIDRWWEDKERRFPRLFRWWYRITKQDVTGPL